MIHGKPGIGKSSIVHQFAEAMRKEYKDFRVIDKRAVNMEPTDITGLPWFNGDFSDYKIWEWLPRDGHGVIFFDEYPQAILATQNSLSELILDRRVGKFRLPEGWSIVLAGNMKSDKAGIVELASHMKSRLIHVQLQEDLADFVSWAEKSGAIRDEVLNFLQYKPDLLCKFKPDDMAYPCPRTWEFASQMIEQCKEDGQPHSIMLKFIAGAVGEGAASELMSFIKIYETLPEIKTIFEKPDKAKVFKEPSTALALALCLARRVNEGNIDALVVYLNRCEPEVAVKCMTDAVKLNPKLKDTEAYKAWHKANKNIVA
jgi:hypothetical protein